MASTAVVANTPAAISTRAARLAIAAIAAYQVLLIVMIFLRPDLDPSWRTMSEWAIGPHGWIMSGAFLISALSYAALLLMLKCAATWNSWPYRTRNTLDLCDWRGRRGNIYDRSYAASLPAIHQGHTSRDIRHQSVGAPSICSAAFQPQPGLQQ